MKSNLKQSTGCALRSFLLPIALLCIISSCSSYKNIPYVQDVNLAEATTTALNNYSPLIIQPEDQLSINVESKNPEASAVFNNNNQNTGATPTDPTYGYRVTQSGEIVLPLIGNMHVAGLTTSELDALIQEKLHPFLRDPNVMVRILNFKVSVLGDVQRPNIYSSASERFTITEALSLAGDLNITALRKNVILIREENGKRIVVPIDLTSKQLFDSPYFYLKANDQLIVQPGKLKLAAVDTGYRNASLIISALSVVAITFSFFK